MTNKYSETLLATELYVMFANVRNSPVNQKRQRTVDLATCKLYANVNYEPFKLYCVFTKVSSLQYKK